MRVTWGLAADVLKINIFKLQEITVSHALECVLQNIVCLAMLGCSFVSPRYLLSSSWCLMSKLQVHKLERCISLSLSLSPRICASIRAGASPHGQGQSESGLPSKSRDGALDMAQQPRPISVLISTYGTPCFASQLPLARPWCGSVPAGLSRSSAGAADRCGGACGLALACASPATETAAQTCLTFATGLVQHNSPALVQHQVGIVP